MTTLRRFVFLTLVCALALPTTSALAKDESLAVSLSRTEVATRLGESFDFTSRITNNGPVERSGLVAHLNVVGLSEDIYVDPEDWSEERTGHLAPIGPGESVDVDWSVKAVTGGDAAIYVVALPGEDPGSAKDGLALSPALDVRIEESRTLNTDGVLPLAIGVPAVLGLVTLGLRARRRR
jgi:hypothetical protein